MGSKNATIFVCDWCGNEETIDWALAGPDDFPMGWIAIFDKRPSTLSDPEIICGTCSQHINTARAIVKG
jgi:hypothetical protein